MRIPATSKCLLLATFAAILLAGCAAPFSAPSSDPLASPQTDSHGLPDPIRIEAASMIEAGAAAGSQHPFRSTYAHFRVDPGNYTAGNLFVTWTPTSPNDIH